MIITMIDGATRICGKSQGYLGLPVRDETIVDKTNGETCNMMHTAWEPTPEEIQKIAAGRPIIVSFIGVSPMPMQVNVG